MKNENKKKITQTFFSDFKIFKNFFKLKNKTKNFNF